jgi:glycine/D-amino acid oxidase-like deaminating enzyme/nitrite reductase/ring-hydroxylating ferredoxin subunit
MTFELPDPESYWLVSAPAPPPGPVPELADVDVAVLGGGIAGITTAHLLKQAGLTVALIEARELLEGVTGHTTAKVSAQHGLIYADLARRFGADAARVYGLSQLTALEWIRAESTRLGIDCEWSERDSFVYCSDPAGLDEVREEAEVAASLGLPASFVSETDLPVPVAGAVRFAGQAQFHPVRWLRTLAAGLPGDGSYVAEGVRALDVRTGDPHRVVTEAGTFGAAHVVVATHYPILDRGFFFARLEPVRELVVAGPMPAATAPKHMYLSTDDGHSVRTTPYAANASDGSAQVLAIVLGEHYRPGAETDVEERHAALASWALSSLGLAHITYRWSAQDNVTVDGLPYIGRFSRRSDRLWVATGFGQWGMTNGTLAGLLLRDLISERSYEWTKEWADLYDPARLPSPGGLVRDQMAVAEHFVADRLRAVGARAPADLAPGEAATTTVGTRLAAVRRDADGTLVALSGRCTHLGCAVAFNDDEQSWDCPCHGSRFGLDGGVLQGPAVTPLERVEIADADASFDEDASDEAAIGIAEVADRSA